MSKKSKDELLASTIEKKKDRIPLDVDELAVYFGISKRTVERLYDDFNDPNKLKATRYGKQVRFTWDNIEEFDRSHSQNSILSLLNLTEDDVAEMFDEHGNLQ